MTTATIERDALVSQPAREVIYTARRSDLQLIKTARYPILNPMGQKTGTDTPGITLQFIEGMLRLPLEGKVQTKHGIEVDAAELHSWLETHRLNGDAYEGFVQLTVTAPPVNADEMRALTRASMSLNEDALREIIEQEEAGWGREDILGTAREALESIQALKAEHAASEAVSKPAPGKKAPREG